MTQYAEPDPFLPLPSLRSSQRLADVIRKTIIDGTFRPGDLLPPERTLALRFRVTRNTVRDALRSLEQLRLVSIRQGSGVRVRDYLASAGVEFLASLLASDPSADLMGEVLEARAVLGRAMFQHAVDHFDLSRVAPLAQAIEAFHLEATASRPSPRKLQDLEFDIHSSLLRGAGNRAFLFLHNSLRHTYEPLAHLFEQIVGRPSWLADQYRIGLAALHAGDRHAARVAFCATLGMGEQAP